MEIRKIMVALAIAVVCLTSVVSANVYITDLNVGYDIDGGYFGVAEYKYTENTYGFLLIVLDEWAIAMVPVQSGIWTGVREWKTRDFYFSVNQSMGIHNVTAFALNVENQMNTSYLVEDIGLGPIDNVEEVVEGMD